MSKSKLPDYYHPRADDFDNCKFCNVRFQSHIQGTFHSWVCLDCSVARDELYGPIHQALLQATTHDALSAVAQRLSEVPKVQSTYQAYCVSLGASRRAQIESGESITVPILLKPFIDKREVKEKKQKTGRRTKQVHKDQMSLI